MPLPRHTYNCIFHRFEALLLISKKPSVIQTTKMLLRRIHLSCNFFRVRGEALVAPIPGLDNVNVRVFMTTFVITNNPRNVFDNSLPEYEKNLKESAAEVLRCFTTAIEQYMARGQRFHAIDLELLHEFPRKLVVYLRHFNLWKREDGNNHKFTLSSALYCIFQAQDALPANEPNDSPLSVELRNQIQKMSGTLRVMCGQAALDEVYRQCRCGFQEFMPPAGYKVDSRSNINWRMLYKLRVDNALLAHELLIDPTFRLPYDPYEESIEAINDAKIRNFWESAIRNFMQGRYHVAVRIFKEVREHLLELGDDSHRETIHDMINVDSMELPTFTLNDAKTMIVNSFQLVLRFQAPRRDEEVNAKYQRVMATIDAATTAETLAKAYVEALRLLRSCTGNMQMDAANLR